MPALAALPLKGKTAPILTVLSCADAWPARATEIEAAHSSPRICLNLMSKRLREVRSNTRRQAPHAGGVVAPPFPLFFCAGNIACRLCRGKLAQGRAGRAA